MASTQHPALARPLARVVASQLNRYRWPLGLALVATLSAAYLVMREADALLMLLESAGEQRYGMSAFNGLQGDGETARRALTFWARSGGRPFEWVWIYAIADCVFALCYTLILLALLRRLFRAGYLRARPRERAASYATLGVLFAADVLENVLTMVAAGLSRSRITAAGLSQLPAVADHVYLASAVKWAALLAVVAILVVGLADVHFGEDDPARRDVPRWWRVAWRLRVPVGVVAVLGFLVAVPSNDRLGALQQLPDVLRSYLTDSGAEPSALMVSLIAPAFLGVAIWVSAHWLPYGTRGAEYGWRWPYRVLAGLAVLWTVLFLAQVAAPRLLRPFGVAHAPPWSSQWRVAVPSLAAAVVLGATLWLHYKYRRDGVALAGQPWHPRYARIINLLAVAPLAIAGLGLVRAAAGMALLPGAAGRGVVGIVAGGFIAIVLAPAALGLLGWWARRELDDVAGEPIAVPGVVNVLVIGLTAVTVGLLAALPVRLGPMVGVPGILTVSLVAATLGLGGLVAVGLRTRPFAVNLVTATDRRPVAMPAVLLFFAVLVVVNVTDGADTYHEVRYQQTEAFPANRTLAGHFAAWKQAMQQCGGSGTAPTNGQQPRLQPMVFVAAAGGGIRAAYWTEMALLQLTGADTSQPGANSQARCRRDAVFLISGVSGGSVGAALWSMRPVGALRTATPYAKSIAGEQALSAVGAGWLFRDGARAMTGLDFAWPDRAAAMEQVWRDQLRANGADPQQPILPTDSAWRPLPLLNGTDLQTGCRVVIGPIVPETLTELPRNCAELPDRGADLPAAYYLPEFLDTSRCDADGRHTLSLTTAALLSARFPYVTPTGLLYACSADRTKAVQVQIGDGGYLESSGLQAALQTYRAVEPAIADHNREVLDGDPVQPTWLANTVIVPVFVVIGNSYRTVAAASAPAPRGELLAPISGSNAAKTALSASRLEAEVRAALSRPVPGTAIGLPGFDVRVVVIAPTSRPEITAPLGWSLSAATQRTLDEQIATQALQNSDLRALRRLLPGDTPINAVTVVSQVP